MRSRYELWNEGGTDAMIRDVWHRDIAYQGEVVLNELSLRIGGQASGVQLDVAIFHLLRFDERLRAIELHEYTRIEQALEAMRG